MGGQTDGGWYVGGKVDKRMLSDVKKKKRSCGQTWKINNEPGLSAGIAGVWWQHQGLMSNAGSWARPRPTESAPTFQQGQAQA